MSTSKIDWTKRVAESGGTSIFLPAGFTKAQEELEAMRKEYNEDAIKMAEREIKMNIANQNLFLEIRKYLAKNGNTDIWVKQIGFDAMALKENKFVINISEQNQ